MKAPLLHRETSQKQEKNSNSSGSSSPQFAPSQWIDNRRETIVQRQLQAIIQRYVEAQPHAQAMLGAQSEVVQLAIAKDRLNVVGENHAASDLRRDKEIAYVHTEIGQDAGYWREDQFALGDNEQFGDPKHLRLADMLMRMNLYFTSLEKMFLKYADGKVVMPKQSLLLGLAALKKGLDAHFPTLIGEIAQLHSLIKNGKNPLEGEMTVPEFKELGRNMLAYKKDLVAAINNINLHKDDPQKYPDLAFDGWAASFQIQYQAEKSINPYHAGKNYITEWRSVKMMNAANAGANKLGIWKVGKIHASDIQILSSDGQIAFNLVQKPEFDRIMDEFNP